MSGLRKRKRQEKCFFQTGILFKGGEVKKFDSIHGPILTLSHLQVFTSYFVTLTRTHPIPLFLSPSTGFLALDFFGPYSHAHSWSNRSPAERHPDLMGDVSSQCSWGIPVDSAVPSKSGIFGYDNNVLLVKIEVPVWYTIYHHLPIV